MVSILLKTLSKPTLVRIHIMKFLVQSKNNKSFAIAIVNTCLKKGTEYVKNKAIKLGVDVGRLIPFKKWFN